MAKIKFNLNFGGEQIRTLDDLRDNFSIEDVLDVYNNGLLVKWLDAHNHKHELEQVNAIQATDARGILSEFIRIFGISDDPEEIQESLSVLDYLKERKKAHEDMKAHGIPDYEKVKKERDELARQIEEMKEAQETETSEPEIHEEAPKLSKKTYEALVQEIIDNHQDLNHIYDCLDAITADYSDVLKGKYSILFDKLYEQAPSSVYALFGHHGTRSYYALKYTELEIDEEHLDNQEARLIYLPNRYRFLEMNDGAWHICYDTGEEVERSIAPYAITEKLSFINRLKALTKRTIIRNGKYIDNHPFLRVSFPSKTLITYDIKLPVPQGMKLLLVYGTHLENYRHLNTLFRASDYRYTNPYGAYEVNKYIRVGYLSLVLPIEAYIYNSSPGDLSRNFAISADTSPTSRLTGHWWDTFCYMEAR